MARLRQLIVWITVLGYSNLAFAQLGTWNALSFIKHHKETVPGNIDWHCVGLFN